MLRTFRIKLQVVFYQFVRNRHKYINDKNFLLIASLVVGVVSGFAAVLLKHFVHLIQHFLESGFDVKYENYLYFIYPLTGILLCVLYVRTFHRKAVFDKGLSSIIYSISRKSSNLERHKSWSHVITAALTTGFGGSVGLEAPIAVTGSAIGSNTARGLLMNRQEKTLLLASGAAAGIAAIFNSPIAGVIFAFEVLLSEVSIAGFIPLLIASASGAVISKFFYTGQLFFLTTEGWELQAIPFYLVLGAFCGLVSVYMIRTTLATESFFHRFKKPYARAITGGLLIGLLIFLFPPLYGEGYNLVNMLMAGEDARLLDKSLFFRYNQNQGFLLLFAGVIILMKVVASAVTVGSGGNGGIFGPSLFTGAFCGYLFSHGINYSGLAQLNEKNFIATAMGGLISGVLHAPLTGIFLIAEITGGYVLFVPLMIVSATAFFITRFFEPHSIYTKTLIERGFISTDKDVDLLIDMDVRNVIETNFTVVAVESTLGDLVKSVAVSKRNIFPVVNKAGAMEGMIILDDIREIMFRTDLYETTFVKDIMAVPQVVGRVTDRMDLLMSRFEQYGIWNIPVVDEHGKYLGFISKSGVLDRYREKLISRSEAAI